ncbi:hypothetical protein HH310_23255 [Actinoplanes sp. TBRC 11911]|uniref:hypothetical protein n=1 Tax=Actinoplanes sp. TBRC 11911 TaxID=2729386 RepID=UPI00145D250F|nr:hypothetical protein [Actinoplanes sp. TBRC 11911]NMO54089.1 hypothetical protein [Actinoplanes sp. TBRC 11911]
MSNPVAVTDRAQDDVLVVADATCTRRMELCVQDLPEGLLVVGGAGKLRAVKLRSAAGLI